MATTGDAPRTVPAVHCDRAHPTLRVRDVAEAVEFYTTQLGFVLAFTWGEPVAMAGVNLDRIQVFLEHGTPDPAGTAVFFLVGDANALFEFHRANGVEVLEAIGDREYDIRDYTIRDRDGNRLSFGHPLMPRTPPLVVERVDVPVRLEKRLVAVLADLAASKGMTVGECLEETLLHTFEPFPDGETVPSPHTRSQLQLIGELKRKHGIEYDCHASYRFVERDAG